MRLGSNGDDGDYPIPASLQLSMRAANGVGSLTNGFTFAQDTSDTQNLVITVLSAPAALPLFTTSVGQFASPAAHVLDGLSGSATDARMIDAITVLQSMGADERAQALRRTAPEAGRSVVQAANQPAGLVLDGAASRLDGLRANGFQVSLLDRLQQGQILLASDDQIHGLFDGAPSLRHGAWVKGFGHQSTQVAQSDYAGYRSDTWGLTVGVDTLLRNDWVAGAALSYSDTRVRMRDFRQGDTTGIQTYQLTAYASRDFGAWFLDGVLSHARQDFRCHRDTGVSGQAQARFSGDQWAGRLQVGAPVAWRDSPAVLTPLLGLEWTRLAQDGYTETDAGALSLQVQGKSTDRLRSVLGAKMGTELSLTGGVSLRPSFQLAWHRDLQNSGLDTVSSFTGGGANFTTSGQNLPRNSWSLGGALAVTRTKAFTLVLQLDGERAPGYTGYAAQAVGRWLF